MNLLITITAFALGCVITGVLIWFFTQSGLTENSNTEAQAPTQPEQQKGQPVRTERRVLSRRLASDVKGHEIRLRELENHLETATRSITKPRGPQGEPRLLNALRDVLETSETPQDRKQQASSDENARPREFSQLGEYRDQQNAPEPKPQELLNDVV